MAKTQVLIIGGAGYIGSHMIKILLKHNYQVVVLDNLVTGNKECVQGCELIDGDFGNSELLNTLFKRYHFNLVLHFAASTSVYESIQKPQKYYQNNFVNSLTLLNVMLAHNVKKLVFASSAAVYGLGAKEPLTLKHPQNPINPYGQSKLMVERLLQDYYQAYGLSSITLRYFNVAGADEQALLGEDIKTSTHLIPLLLKTRLNPSQKFMIFGDDHDTHDGTCIRDYVHISDICSANLLALKTLEEMSCCLCYNIGSGCGTSIKKVIEVTSKVTGQNIPFEIAPKRIGEPAHLIADISMTQQELKWTPRYTLNEIIHHAWAHAQK